jgi:crotonobetainyl-CoA:carnitine CoA-transferase CaiB-like acyl-CoA transferase
MPARLSNRGSSANLRPGTGRTALPRQRYAEEASGPLAGVRVLDLTRLVAGGQFGLVLGDLGADVVKVEQPGVGDPLRRATIGDGYDAHWRVWGRNKRSVTLNIKHPRGRELLFELARHADVLAENFSPGVLERLCGGPDALLEHNPRLVIVRISGWGQTGPLSRRPGFGTLAEAFSGFTFLNGDPNGPPVLPPMSLADTVAGTYAAVAAVSALLHVRGGGEGQVIDVSLFEPLFSMLGPDATALAGAGVARARGDGANVSSVRGVYRTLDGYWLALSAATDDIVRRLFAALDRLDVLDEPRFATSEARLANGGALNELVAAEFQTHTREELLALAEAHRITVGPVYSVADAVADSHYLARGTVVEVTDGDESVVTNNVVPRLSQTPASIRLPAPRLGQHNAEVYAQLGLDESALADLRADEVV